MRLSALVFMAGAWAFVLGLTAWSYRRLLAPPRRDDPPPPESIP